MSANPTSPKWPLIIAVAAMGLCFGLTFTLPTASTSATSMMVTEARGHHMSQVRYQMQPPALAQMSATRSVSRQVEALNGVTMDPSKPMPLVIVGKDSAATFMRMSLVLPVLGAITAIAGIFKLLWPNRKPAQQEELVAISSDYPYPSPVALAAVSGKKAPPVVVPPSYNLAAGTAGLAALLAALPGSGLADVPAGIMALLAALFGVQTGRVKFCFDNEAMELKIGDELKESGENIIVGGANRWNYKSFVNWDIFPSRSFPILVYFKENQTPASKWNEGPGALDKVGGGQIHFFPAVCDVEEICNQFESRGCKQVRK